MDQRELEKAFREKVACHAEIVRRNLERSYYEFFKEAWDILEPGTPLRDNWHIKYLCDRLQVEVERLGRRQKKKKDLIINISPRSLKSYICTIMLQPWAWTRFPHLRFINSSHSRELSIDHCVKSRRVIESNWYQMLWSHVFKMTGDQNVKSHFENDKGGVRMAASVGGTISGHGADMIIADDLLDAKDADSKLARDGANEHYNNALFTRLNDQSLGVRLVVQQRLHDEDLTGHLMKESADKYERICIPMERSEDIFPAPLSKQYTGDNFFPDRFTSEVVAEIKKKPRMYAAQFQQRPRPTEGFIFRPSWWRFWKELPKRFDQQVISADMTFKDRKENDFVVFQYWARFAANFYLIDQVRGQWDFPKTIEMFLSFIQKHPSAMIRLIEDKANGPAVISTLQGKVPGLIAINPEGSKEARAHAVTHFHEGGNVYLPDPNIHPWVFEFIDEHSSFPSADHDDQVDAGTQALARMGLSSAVQRLEQFLGG
jgi:predicted phage terminase large subunit-like protein